MTPSVSPQIRLRGAAVAEPNRLQPGEYVATVGVAEEDWELVVDEFTAATGKDG